MKVMKDVKGALQRHESAVRGGLAAVALPLDFFMRFMRFMVKQGQKRLPYPSTQNRRIISA